MLCYLRSSAPAPVEREPKIAAEVEVPLSECLKQTCVVTVFHNGMHENEHEFSVSPADMGGFKDLGEYLGPKMGCKSEGMR